MQNYINFVLGTLFLSISLTFSSHAPAAQSIIIEGGEITIEDGHINPQDYTGTASGVIFTAHDGEMVIIDEYEAIKGDDVDIKSLTLTGIQIVASDELTLIDQFTAQDLIINHMLFSGKNFKLIVDPQNILTIDQILMEGAGNYATEISDDMPENISLQIAGMRYTPHPSDTATRNALKETLGVENINADLLVEANGEAMDDRVNINSSFNLSLEDVGAVNFAIDFGMFYEGIAKLFSQSLFATDNDYDEIAETLMETLLLNSASLQLNDDGMVEVGLTKFAQEQGISRDNAVPYIMDRLAQIGPDVAPKIYSALQLPLQHFLERGGQFSINLTPDEPAPASTLFMLMMMPDMIVSSLGLSITHQP